MKQAQGPWGDLALHTIGWKGFQDLCSEVFQDYLNRPVEVFSEANDGGQDAVFLLKDMNNIDTVGTVQCKHFSDPSRGLRFSDISGEIEKVEELVHNGQADSYIFITNLAINARTAAEIRIELKNCGVSKPHIFGKHFIQRAIRSSSRLRALVPQVYGLGDLSAIVDERAIAQTAQILGNWTDRLKAYVPTESHQKAIKSIDSLGVVMLLGNPGSGKSAIGAILASIASDSLPYEVIFINNPNQFDTHWNPNVKGRFYWIDDAFGSNRIRDEFIEDWTQILPKVSIAIKNGNRFLFTSRSYIYHSAKRLLGSRNLQEFSNNTAIVEVGHLSLDEKSRILYNHIKFGNQKSPWKRKVSHHLHYLANVQQFLPIISERLGNSSFTQNLAVNRNELLSFMEEPKEHLIETINALEKPIRGLLILIYANRGTFDQSVADPKDLASVSDITGVKLADMISCLDVANGAFIRKKSGTTEWIFSHPTIFDALTDIVSNESSMQEALVRGANVDFILNQFTCAGSSSNLRTPLQINLEPILLQRLSEVSKYDSFERSYLLFLAHHVSDNVFRELYNENTLDEDKHYFHNLRSDSTIQIASRALKLGLLSGGKRRKISETIKEKIVKYFDFTIFECPGLLEVIEPNTLFEIGCDISGVLTEDLVKHIQSIGEDTDIDLEVDPDSYFSDIRDSLSALEFSDSSSRVQDALADVYNELDNVESDIKTKIEEFEQQKLEEEAEAEEWEREQMHRAWSEVRATDGGSYTSKKTEGAPRATRSIFSDVAD